MLGVLDVLAGAAFAVLGVVAVRDSWRYAAVCAGAALAWFLAPLAALFLFVHRPLVLHAALGYPTGRLPGGSARALLGATWAAALLPSVGRHPGVMLLLGILTAAVAASREARAAWSRRAEAATSAAATLAVAMSLIVPATGRLVFGAGAAADLLSGLYSGFVLLAGLILLAGVLLGSHRSTADVVIELSETTSGEVVEALRQEAAVQRGAGNRQALLVAAELLEDNARLQAGLAASVADVRASRERLVAAGVTERRRLGQLLDGGARRHLAELRGVLSTLDVDDEVRRLAAACCAEIDRTEDDLAQLAQGLHPRVLVEQGLHAALADLAARNALPVEVQGPDGRLPEPVESAVWYACAEALTNVAKHAGATRAAVEVRVAGGEVVGCVRDDGVGGARAVPGGGLAGLADRLTVVGGRLAVEPEPGGGTRVCIHVPVR